MEGPRGRGLISIFLSPFHDHFLGVLRALRSLRCIGKNYFRTYYLNLENKKIEKIENFGDGPGCFGECRGVIPEYFYGIFEEF